MPGTERGASPGSNGETKQMIRKVGLLIVCVAIVLPGCAGTRFARLSGDQLVLGQDTMQTIRQKLGKPFQEGTVVQNGETFKSVSYSFAAVGMKSFFGGVTKGRTQVFYFHDDVLVGSIYVSSYQEDTTNFDESQLEKIKEGKTRQEVLSVLGEPSGEYIYPLVEKENHTQDIYYYYQTRAAFLKIKIYQEILKITYDTAGIVTKVEFVEAGEK